MSGYRFSPRAREDLREIHDYVAKDGLRIAARLIDRLEEACELLVRFPELGERREDLAPSVRCFSVGNYAIFYRPAALPPRTWTDDTGKFPAKLGNARILANPATMLETRF